MSYKPRFVNLLYNSIQKFLRGKWLNDPLYLSYVIQNFEHHHFSVKASWKVKAVFVARNFATIYTFLNSLSTPFNLNAITWNISRILRVTLSRYFTHMYDASFPKVKDMRHTPIGVNFPKSTHYFALTQLNRALTSFTSVSTSLPLTERRVLYPYPFASPLVITPVANNFSVDLLYRFFKASLTVWFTWPSRYKTWVHYSYLTPRLRQLTFLNKYYFKVYHV